MVVHFDISCCLTLLTMSDCASVKLVVLAVKVFWHRTENESWLKVLFVDDHSYGFANWMIIMRMLWL